jgi:hypothetical protein
MILNADKLGQSRSWAYAKDAKLDSAKFRPCLKSEPLHNAIESRHG